MKSNLKIDQYGKNYKRVFNAVKERRYRYFSETLKQEKVKEVNEGRSRISDICRAYQV